MTFFKVQVLLLFIATVTFAQSPKVTTTVEYNHPGKRDYLRKYIGAIPGQHIFVRTNSKAEACLEFCNNEFQLASKVVIPFEKIGKENLILWDIYLLKNKFMAVYTLQNFRTSERSVYARDLDITGKFITEPKLLMKLGTASNLVYGDYHLAFAFDSSMFAISTRIPDVGNTTTFGLFDAGYNKLLEKTVSLETPGSKYQIKEIAVDKNKNIYFNAKVKSKDSKGKFLNKNQIYSYQNSLSKVDLMLGEFFPVDIKLKATSSSIVGAALISKEAEPYSPQKDWDNIEVNNNYLSSGMFYFWIAPNEPKIKTSYKKMFEGSFMSDFNYRLNEKKSELGIPYLQIKELLIQPTSEVTAIAESQYDYLDGDSRPNQQRTQVFEYGNIIVSSVSADGKKSWNAGIRKNQIFRSVVMTVSGGNAFDYIKMNNYSRLYGSDEVEYFGIKGFYSGDKVFIVYNDRPANLTKTTEDKKKLEEYDGKGKYVTVLSSVDKIGKINEEVIDSSENKIYSSVPKPVFIEQHSINKEALLYASFENQKFRIIKIKWD